MKVVESKKLQIKCDEEPRPHCAHGPCLLFFEADSEDNGYFGCAAYRDKRDCNFRLSLKQFNTKYVQREYVFPVDEYRAMREKLLKHTKTDSKPVYYCHTCNLPLLSLDLKQHSSTHEVQKITPKQLADPTCFLQPLENDKAQAQYFFDEKALKFFGSCFCSLGINKVLCIGAPRLHAYLSTNSELDISSYLLDFDHRFYHFYDDRHFAWYNMCNNHFFDAQQKQEFLNFVRIDCDNSEQRILLFTDPPFGCRTEPIAYTLRCLTCLYNNINKLPHQPLPIFWIFPYFSAPYIQEEMPEFECCDYKVNYTNHTAYSNTGDKANRKLGSPVRMFTNIGLNLLRLPVEEGYKYCVPCGKYTALENRHCNLCGTCPSKNGSTYKHCQHCGLCTKPNYIHCNSCRRCTQQGGHNCQEYQLKQRCWVCRQVGHIERNCKLWQQISKKMIFANKLLDDGKQILCLLCQQLAHNEQNCPMRKKLLEETTFLGKTQIKVKIS